MIDDYRVYVLGAVLVLLLIGLLTRPKKPKPPKPPKDEAVTLNIVPGPVREQGEADDSD